jgi:hypothetical protein
LIAVGVARSRSKALQILLWPWPRVWFCGLSAYFLNTKSRTKKHKLSPMVESYGLSYYGDKILARVNSGELVLNSDQQSKLYGQMNSGGGDDHSFIED